MRFNFIKTFCSFHKKVLSVPEVASISGHRTPSQLFRYAHASLACIQKKLLDGFTFHGYEAFGYEDYGTVTEFKNYIKNVRSIFCDFDGVLVENSSKFNSPPWQYNPILKNLNYLSDFLKTLLIIN